MFAEMEEFFKAHEHTVAALEALSTFAVVLVSVTLALVSQRANRTKVKAFASISVMLHSTLEGKPKPTYMTVFIRNAGVMPATIPFSFFYWKAPFKTGGWTVNPWDYSASDEWVVQKRYPVEIKPRSSENFFLADKAMFERTMLEMFSGAGFIDRCRFRFLKARVVTDDNKIFDVKLHKTLRKELRALRAEAFKTPAKLLAQEHP
jgi:hypothetical protein